MEPETNSTQENPQMSQKSRGKKKHYKKRYKSVAESKSPEYKFTGQKGTRVRKGMFVSELAVSLYNIKFACKQIGVDRRTYTRWKTTDPEFARACYDINEGIKDEAEVMLQHKITEKDTSSLLFFLKTKCKDRGYAERREIAHEGQIETTQLIPGVIVIEAPNDEEETTEEDKSVPYSDKEESEEVPKPEVPDKVESNDTPQDPIKPGWVGPRV